MQLALRGPPILISDDSASTAILQSAGIVQMSPSFPQGIVTFCLGSSGPSPERMGQRYFPTQLVFGTKKTRYKSERNIEIAICRTAHLLSSTDGLLPPA